MEVKNSTTKLGIALGSGGIKSLSALPLLFLLKNKGVEFHLISGSGAGAIIAALFAAGQSYEEIVKNTTSFFERSLMKKTNLKTMLSLATYNHFGGYAPLTDAILHNNALLKNYSAIFGDTKLQELPIRVLVQSTDFVTGNGIILEKGYLREILYASNACYPVLAPIELDGLHLVEGFYSAALPIYPLLNQKLDFIVGIGFNQHKYAEPKTAPEYLINSLNRCYTSLQTGQNFVSLVISDLDVMFVNIDYPTGLLMWDTQELEGVLKHGQSIAEQHGPEIISLLKK